MPKCSCGKHPIYNMPGETKPVCCKMCKKPEMIDVKNKRCPCGKQPTFNVLGETKGVCCVKCKTVDMINIVSKRCPCGNQPTFNVLGETKGVCCKMCKTDDMIDVKNKRCPCGKQPIYNMPGEFIGVACSKCKTDEMVDVVNKKCLCGKHPIYNIPGETIGVACSKCKTDDMIDVRSKKCSCGKIPSFNVPGQTKGVCCLTCKTNEMIDVVNKVCPGYNTSCPVRTYVSRGHKYCMSCDTNDERRKRYKLHEEAFFAYAKDKIDVYKREFHVSFDPTYTSNKFARVDGIVFGDDVIVCLEVDENKHQEYECDEHRMHLVTAELLQKYPEHVVSWVRVNPTVDAKSQWSKKSQKIRETHFEDAVMIVNDILETRDTRVVYVGFD